MGEPVVKILNIPRNIFGLVLYPRTQQAKFLAFLPIISFMLNSKQGSCNCICKAFAIGCQNNLIHVCLLLKWTLQHIGFNLESMPPEGDISNYQGVLEPVLKCNNAFY